VASFSSSANAIFAGRNTALQSVEKPHAEKRSEKPRKGTNKQTKAEPIVGIASVVIELNAKKTARLSLIRVPKNLNLT